MPSVYSRSVKKRLYKKKSRKTRFVKKYNKSVNNWIQGRLLSAFPNRLLFKHKYVQEFQMTLTSAATSSYNFRCNSVYAPNATGSSHQAYYFDQLGALYDHFTVIGSKIRYVITPLTSLAGPIRFVSYVNDDATITPSNLDTMNEFSRKTQSKILPVTNTRPVVLTNKWSMKKYFPGANIAGSRYFGGTGGGPLEESMFSLAGHNMDGVSTETVSVVAIVEYITVWWERKDIAGS